MENAVSKNPNAVCHGQRGADVVRVADLAHDGSNCAESATIATPRSALVASKQIKVIEEDRGQNATRSAAPPSDDGDA